jgi:hypothetical protein
MSLSERKRYAYKIYDSSNTFIGYWDDVVSDFQYSQQLNTAGSAVDITLGRTSETLSQALDTRITEASDTRITEDGRTRVSATTSPFSVGGNSDVALNNNVVVYVFFGQLADRITETGDTRITESGDTRIAEDGSPNGRILFTGYISKFVSHYGSQETTTATIMSHGAELDNYMLESSSNTTVAYSSQDPTTILQDVLDKFTSAGGLADYNSGSTVLTGTTVSYTFKVNTTLEAIQKCLELAPTDWFWRINMADNIIYFNPRPTNTSHTFILGKHIKDLQLEQHIEELVNTVYFTGAESAGVNLFNKYTDATSIASYRPGLKKITDSRVSSNASAEIISESEIDRLKDPIYRSQITISDKVYPIEDIELGQLIGFKNFGNFIDSLTMQIMGITYSPDGVTLELDSLLPQVSKRVEDVRRNLNQQEVINNPSAP